MNQIKKNINQLKRKRSVRKKLKGTAKRPRLSIYRSNRYLYLQLIDDETGKSILTITDAGKDSQLKGTKTEKATVLAQELAKKMKTKKISQIVFDRGPYQYHGRIKATAEALRAAGIKF